MLRRYETIIIVKPVMGEDEIQGIVEKTTGIIEGFDGSMVRTDRWGLKKLAYLIQKEQQGFYIYFEYAGTPEAVNEIERIYRIDDRIMKYLTVKLQDVFAAKPEDEEIPEEATEKTPEETTDTDGADFDEAEADSLEE
ncbi:MAG: 30S ribosomal protein S6 [Proteobacteria bacterium]|nr:30S ribosomal protein S6 [Pseudomonadota bacterium]MBU1688064.1 30S ribosomal protein S6 [Pseudomonadota bacterium]